MSPETSIAWGLVVVGGAACWTDLRTRRIPNWLTLSGLIAGLVVRFLLGLNYGLDGLWGASVAFIVAVPLLALGAFGGGDAKLLIAVGAFVGLDRLLWALGMIGVTGGVLALLDVVRRGSLGVTLAAAWNLLVYVFSLGRSGARRTLQTPGASSIPYGVAIAVGAVVGWIAGGW